MKLLIPILAALFLPVMVERPASGASLEVESSINGRHVISRASSQRHKRVHVNRYVYDRPLACDAVLFPRSPLCEPNSFARALGFWW